MGKYDEKREDKRISIKLRIDYKSEDTFLFEYTENFSNNGIFVNTPDPLPPGTTLELQFHPDTPPNDTIKVLGEVIWVNEGKESGKPGMGIKFINISEKTREKLATLVKRLAVL